MSREPTPEEKAEAERDMAVEGAALCLHARDTVEAMTDRELVANVEKEVWGKLCAFGSPADWLLDELINRFETQRGIERDEEGKILPPPPTP